MSRSLIIKLATGSLILAAAALGLFLGFTFSGGSTDDGKSAFPGIKLALTAEAAGLLQADTAFPADRAGQSSYVTGVTELSTPASGSQGQPGFIASGIDRTLNNLLQQNPGSQLSASFTNNKGSNFAIVSLRVLSINGMLYVDPQVYFDNTGKVVAFFLLSQPASSLMQWQVVSDIEAGTFQFAGINTTVLLDAVRKTLQAAGLDATAVSAKMQTAQHFNFKFVPNPTTGELGANSLLVLANTKGEIGEEVATFALPANWIVLEVSWSSYTAGLGGCCDNYFYLDSAELQRHYYTDAVRAGHAGLAAFTGGAGLTGHSYKILRQNGSQGSNGLAIVIVLRKP